ncbi:MAG: alpha/beta fold hydrolase [Kofleriaceae bacterium]
MTEALVRRRDGHLWTRVVGDSQGVPLLCIPGGPACAHDYIASVAAIAERGRAVVLYDPYGSGRSPAPPTTTYDVDALRDDVEAVRAGLGLPRVHLFAHSAGSFAAIEYALAHPQRVASLVLSSPVFDVPAYQREVHALLARFGEAAADAFIRAEREPRRRNKAYMSMYYEYIARHVCRFGDVRRFAQLAGRGFNARAHLQMKGGLLVYTRSPLDQWSSLSRHAAIHAPVLITCGAFDVTPVRLYEEAARTLARAEVSVFEQSSHAQYVEEPARFIEVVSAFLDRSDS